MHIRCVWQAGHVFVKLRHPHEIVTLINRSVSPNKSLNRHVWDYMACFFGIRHSLLTYNAFVRLIAEALF